MHLHVRIYIDAGRWTGSSRFFYGRELIHAVVVQIKPRTSGPLIVACKEFAKMSTLPLQRQKSWRQILTEPPGRPPCMQACTACILLTLRTSVARTKRINPPCTYTWIMVIMTWDLLSTTCSTSLCLIKTAWKSSALSPKGFCLEKLHSTAREHAGEWDSLRCSVLYRHAGAGLHAGHASKSCWLPAMANWPSFVNACIQIYIIQHGRTCTWNVKSHSCM